MPQSAITGRLIEIGYPWVQRLAVEGVALFPSGATFTAQFRASRDSENILATLTTGNGGITRISDTEIELNVSATDTANMTVGKVMFDIVRTDVSPDAHLGFTVTVPVVRPITRL